MKAVAGFKPRTSWQVTKSVWYAMFMREAISRTMSDRFAWFWMLFEPMLFIFLMVGVREFLGKLRFIVGAEFIPWLVTGLLTFLMFRVLAQKSEGAIQANKALFSHRQVLPIDPVLVRSAVEGMLRTIVFCVFFTAGLLLEYDINSGNALGIIEVWVTTWLLGLSCALVISVPATLISEVKLLVKVIMLPLLIMSGVVLPVIYMPHDVLEILMYNPVLHVVELMRGAFFPDYKVVPGADITYVFYWIISMTLLGLMLHIRYKDKLKSK